VGGSEDTGGVTNSEVWGICGCQLGSSGNSKAARTFRDGSLLAGILCHSGSTSDVLLVQTALLQLLDAVAEIARSSCHEGSTLSDLSLHVMARMSEGLGCENRCGDERGDELHVGGSRG